MSLLYYVLAIDVNVWRLVAVISSGVAVQVQAFLEVIGNFLDAPALERDKWRFTSRKEGFGSSMEGRGKARHNIKPFLQGSPKGLHRVSSVATRVEMIAQSDSYNPDGLCPSWGQAEPGSPTCLPMNGDSMVGEGLACPLGGGSP